jgi:allantoin racemase
MKLLLVNPNTTSAITDRLMAAALQAAAPGTEITRVTAKTGVPYISTRTEEAIAAVAVLEILADQGGAYDGAIIAAFGDPGLLAAKELFDFPVVGLAEASMLAACALGRRFGIVTFAQALGDWYGDSVRRDRLEVRCAGIRALDEPFAAVADVQSEKQDKLVELALASVERDGADVVILAGAPLAGLAPLVADRIPVPLVDCCAAAVVQLEAAVRLAPRKATAGSGKRPAFKPSVGLAPGLAKRLAGDT